MGLSNAVFTGALKSGGIALEQAGRNPVALLKPAGSFESNAGVLNVTLATTLVSPVPFYGFRVRAFGLGATAQINCQIACAVSANMTGGQAIATGSPLQVLFGGASTFTRAAAPLLGDSANTIWSEIVSDWVASPSIVRDDAGPGYLLMLRSYTPSVGNTIGNRCGGQAASATDINAYGCGGAFGSGNTATVAAWATYSQSGTGLADTVAVELLTKTGVLTLATFGDSTIGGTGGAIASYSGAQNAWRGMFSAARPLAHWNNGEASMRSDYYVQLAQAFFTAGHKTNIAAYCGFSPNDTDKYTRAGTDRQIAGIMIFLHECRKSGALPVLVTPCPVGGLTAPQEAFRREVVQATKAIADTFRAEVVDRDAIYTNYALDTGGWIVGMTSEAAGSALHPNATGYAAEGVLWRAVLDKFAL